MILSIYILMCIVVFLLFSFGMSLAFLREKILASKTPIIIVFLASMILAWALAASSFNIELVLCGATCAIQQYASNEMGWIFYGIAALSFILAMFYTLFSFEGAWKRK